MKRQLLAAFLVAAVTGLHAQMKIQQVITPAGGSKTAPDGSYYIGWTLGETLVSTWRSADGSLILSAGQQGIIITAVEDVPDWDAEVIIYPNPAGSQLTIKFFVPANEKFLLYLYDAEGRLIMSDRIEQSTDIKQINLDGLSPGMYFLRLTDGVKTNTYKVVKL